MLSEIKRGKKKLVKDPIKSIGVGAGNTAREIVIQIASALGLKVHSDGIGVSAYGGTTIRIADHRTYMQTWVDSGAWQSPYRFDVVIEDDETVARTQVKDGYDFTITEFISKSCEMTPQIARMIAYDIRNTIDTGNRYANNVRAFKTTLISTHGAEGSSDNANNDNNDIKTENYMRNNKRTIRLSESDLHRVIKESVRKIVNEYYDHNKSDYENQLTIDELIGIWENYGGLNERVEIFDGINGFKTVHWADGNQLFLSRKDYETYLKKQEGGERRYAEEHSGKYGGGEGNQYLSNPSSLPAGLR